MTTQTTDTAAVYAIADRVVAALEHGDEAELAELYHPDLRFTIRTAGAVYDRAGALRNFRTLWPRLRDVEVEVVDRQITELGFLSQQVLSATIADRTRLSVPMCMIFQLRDGQIVRIDEYFDPAAVGPLAALIPAT
jgi:ketosteroid isomerase-like protein